MVRIVVCWPLAYDSWLGLLLRKQVVEPLKPMEVVSHVDELLGIGETLGSLKKQKVKVRRIALDDTRIAAIEEAQAAYKFKPEAWKLLGVEVDGNGKVVVEGAPKAKRGPKKKSKKG